MRISKIPVRHLAVIATVFGSLTLAAPILSSGQKVNSALPVFHCRMAADSECAYTIHDDHGSINLILTGGQSHGYNETLIGARYCANYGAPRQPTPDWPKCWSIPNDRTHTHKVVVAGEDNG
jgi:hypothetical protein